MGCGVVAVGWVGGRIFLWSGLGGGEGVALPEVFEGFGQGLLFDGAVGVPCVAGEEELVVVAPGGEDAGHVFVGEDPVVLAVAHRVGVEEVAVAYLHPQAYGFGWGIGDESLVELPCAAGGVGVGWPLLVHEGSGVGQDAVVKLGVVPGHDEGTGASGAAAHGGSAVGVVGKGDVELRLDAGKDFVLDELGVVAGHGVVFEAALGALGVATAVGDGDGDEGGEFVLGDEVVEGGEKQGVGAIGTDEEGSGGSGNVLGGDVDGDFAGVGCRVAGGDDELGWVVRVWDTEGIGVAGDAGVVGAFGGGEGEGRYGAVRDGGLGEGIG